MTKNFYRALLFLLTVTLFILFQSCNSNTTNIAEKRIEGKWKQVKGTEPTSNIDLEYVFSAGNKFKMLTTVANQPLTSREGSYKIENDTLYLFYENDPAKIWFSAKILFKSDARMSLLNTPDEYEFRKEELSDD